MKTVSVAQAATALFLFPSKAALATVKAKIDALQQLVSLRLAPS